MVVCEDKSTQAPTTSVAKSTILFAAIPLLFLPNNKKMSRDDDDGSLNQLHEKIIIYIADYLWQ